MNALPSIELVNVAKRYRVYASPRDRVLEWISPRTRHTTFDALRGVLVPGGWLCFSVEPLSDAEAAAHPEGWCLRPSLRYAQSPAYLQRLCAGNGWRWGGWQAFDLRLEQGRPLAGAVVWMQAQTDTALAR